MNEKNSDAPMMISLFTTTNHLPWIIPQKYDEDINPIGWAMSYGFGPRFIFLGLPWQIDFTWEYNPHIGTITDRKVFLRIFPEF